MWASTTGRDILKVLVTGSNGQLGVDVVKELRYRGFEPIPATHTDMDVTSRDSVESFFSKNMPDAVVHCAAWTNVDLAEDEYDSCRAVNVEGTKNVLRLCKANNIPMMYISTDYVFDGQGNDPWDVDDLTNPVNRYGLSKRDGEDLVKEHGPHFIVRTSWVFGSSGHNFVNTMMKLSERPTINVVCDQYGSPTYTVDLSRLIVDMIVTERYGTYHAHNEGYCSWYEFATEIMKEMGSDCVVSPISSEEYPSKAKRPSNSRLSMKSLSDNGFDHLPHWRDAIHRYIDVSLPAHR